MEPFGTGRDHSERADSSRPGRRRGEEAITSRLRRLGRARNFEWPSFAAALARVNPGRRPELVARLLSEWVAIPLDGRQAEKAWADLEVLFREMQERLTGPLSLQTVILHYFHSQKGLLAEPNLIAGRDLDRLRISAITDPLTRLYNRRFFGESLERYLSRAGRAGQSVSVSLLDLEDFKSINDRFGHPTGDRALVCTADIIRGSLRPGDIACRWGGDEFVLLLPGADFLVCVEVAERIRRRISAPMRRLRPGLALDLYYGVASFPVDGRAAKLLLEVADERLYQCREQRGFGGGNRRRYPRFAYQRMQLRLVSAGRDMTAPVVNVSYGGLAYQARGESVPSNSEGEISQPDREKPRSVRLRVAHTARLPGGRLRVGCKYS